MFECSSVAMEIHSETGCGSAGVLSVVAAFGVSRLGLTLQIIVIANECSPSAIGLDGVSTTEMDFFVRAGAQLQGFHWPLPSTSGLTPTPNCIPSSNPQHRFPSLTIFALMLTSASKTAPCLSHRKCNPSSPAQPYSFPHCLFIYTVYTSL